MPIGNSYRHLSRVNFRASGLIRTARKPEVKYPYIWLLFRARGRDGMARGPLIGKSSSCNSWTAGLLGTPLDRPGDFCRYLFVKLPRLLPFIAQKKIKVVTTGFFRYDGHSLFSVDPCAIFIPGRSGRRSSRVRRGGG